MVAYKQNNSDAVPPKNVNIVKTAMFSILFYTDPPNPY